MRKPLGCALFALSAESEKRVELMDNLNTISHVEQNEIALAEQAAKDLIAIGEALSGLLGLRQGGVVVGMSATQYLDALRSLVAAGNNATQLKRTED